MPVTMPLQQEPNWCWAAVAVSVQGVFAPAAELAQCEVATPVLIKELAIGIGVDCCATPDQCDIPAFLEDALGGNLKLKSEGHLSFAGVISEVDAGRPVGVRIQWPGGSGHFLLVDGYREFSSGAQQVHVSDPAYGPCYVLYNDLAFAYHDTGVWMETFFLQA